MRKVEISDLAMLDLRLALAYSVKQFGSIQAKRYEDGFFKQLDLLAEFPGLGTAVQSKNFPGARQFGYGSHIIVYRHSETSITVVRLFHGRSVYMRYV